MNKKSKKSSQKKNQRKFKIDPTTATIGGLILAALALIPGFWALFFSKTVPEVINNESSVPLRIEFMNKYSGDTLYAFLPPDILPNQVEFDKLDYISLPMYNNVTFSVTNISDQTIILSKELPVKLIDYQPHPDNVNILVVGAGGGGGFRNFVVDVPTSVSTGIVKAVFDEVPGTGQTIDDIRTEQAIDFFTLAPGEVEVFSLEIRFDGAGSYTFQPGIEYYRNGNVIQVWTPETISALVPQNVTVWDMPTSTDKNEFIFREKCTFAYPIDAPSNFDKVYKCNK